MRAMLLAALPALVFLAGSGAGQAAPLPFVGCPADGQTGPADAPERPDHIPDVAAKGLAYYSAVIGPGVVAPQGWHCFGLYGSNGSILIVTQRAYSGRELLYGDKPIVGPAIQATYTDGGTSGRFEVARVDARLFPSRRAFVRSVIREQIEAASDFPFGPSSTDRLRRHGPTDVEFTTPAGRRGEGTHSRLNVGRYPISGFARIASINDPRITSINDLERLVVRLPPGQRRLVPVIIETARRTWGQQ